MTTGWAYAGARESFSFIHDTQVGAKRAFQRGESAFDRRLQLPVCSRMVRRAAVLLTSLTLIPPSTFNSNASTEFAMSSGHSEGPLRHHSTTGRLPRH